MINIAVKLFEINGLQHTICSAKFILIVQMFALNVQSACRTSLPLPLTACNTNVVFYKQNVGLS